MPAMSYFARSESGCAASRRRVPCGDGKLRDLPHGEVRAGGPSSQIHGSLDSRRARRPALSKLNILWLSLLVSCRRLFCRGDVSVFCFDAVELAAKWNVLRDDVFSDGTIRTRNWLKVLPYAGELLEADQIEERAPGIMRLIAARSVGAVVVLAVNALLVPILHKQFHAAAGVLGTVRSVRIFLHAEPHDIVCGRPDVAMPI